MKIKKRTLASLIRWVVRITITIVVIVIFFTYTRTDIFTITSYDVSGTDASSSVAVIAQVREAVKRPVYFVIPGNKIFTYSNSLVVDAVRTNVPDVATIDMRPVGLHTVKISVTTLTPLFRVGDTQALTEDGVLFTTKNDVSKLPAIVIASSTVETFKRDGLHFSQVILGGEKIEARTLRDIVDFSTKVSSIIFPVQNILVEENGDITVSNASGTSKVLFLKDMDQKKTWSTLVSAIDTDPLKNKLATEKEKLEYLDVRYGNKVFYRFSDMTFQNAKGAVIMNNHATTTPIITATTTR